MGSYERNGCYYSLRVGLRSKVNSVTTGKLRKGKRKGTVSSRRLSLAVLNVVSLLYEKVKKSCL